MTWIIMTYPVTKRRIYLKEMANLAENPEYKDVLTDMKKQLEERKQICEEKPIEL